MEKEEVKEVTNSKKKNNNTIITSRVLFVSVLHIILSVILALSLLFATIENFFGGSYIMLYNFGSRLLSEFGIIFGTVILYFLYNWIYKCISKTMLCLTENEIYIEKYMPLVRHEVSVPLNKITGVSTHRFIYIFRAIVIHQYQKLPIIFWTWTNQEFKDELDKLIVKRNMDKKPINDNKDKNIIPNDKLGLVLGITGGIIVLIMVISGVSGIISKATNPASKMDGKYVKGDYSFTLENDGTCNIDDLIDLNVTECNWSYDLEDNEVNVDYTYEKKSYYGYSTYEYDDTLTFEYIKKNKTLKYNLSEFKKQ